jgi:uncharacterized protein
VTVSAGRFSLHREDGSMRPGWAVAVFALMVAAGTGFEHALGSLTLGRNFWFRVQFGDPPAAMVLCGRAAWALGATWLACRMVHWPIGDAYLRDGRWLARTLQGVALGAVMLAFVSLVPVASGHERFRLSEDDWPEIAATFFWGGLACVGIAMSEELWMRGYALRQLHRAMGRWGAALATGIWFGLLHGTNPHATRLAVANIALIGIWLALTVYRTGSMWMAVGFHFSWDLLECAFWGEPLSGNPGRASVLVPLTPGDALWTGGDFGPEAGLPNTVMLGALILLFALWPSQRRGRPDHRPPGYDAAAAEGGGR